MFKTKTILNKIKITNTEKQKIFSSVPGTKSIKKKYELFTNFTLQEEKFLIFNPTKKDLYLKNYTKPKIPFDEWIPKNYKKIILDAGCSDGYYVFGKSQEEKDNFYIACDRKYDKLISCFTRNQNNQNVKSICSPIQLLLSEYVPNQVLDLILVQFSEPWKEKKKRMLNSELIDLFHQKLKSNGQVILSTDSIELVEWYYEEFIKKNNLFKAEFEGKYTTIEPEETKVKQKGFETFFKEKGLTIYYQKYTKI